MAVSGVSSSSLAYQSNPLADFRQSFMQLAKSINAGDLSGAQQAFAALTQSQGGAQASASQPAANSPLAQALTQIGQDLQNGDITGAQQALDALKTQTQHTHHHGHHHQAASSTDANGTPTDADTDGTAPVGAAGSTLNILA